MDGKTQRKLVAASIAGMLAAVGSLGFGQVVQAKEVHCYGVNVCKGSGDCGGKGHSCAGKNACNGQGYIDLEKDDCLRIIGGSLTPVEVEE